MTAIDDFAGRIVVRLNTTDGHVSAVDIDSTRPIGVAKVFAGRTPAETVGVLGRVFSLCATGQTVAGLEAFESACGLSVSKEQQAARTMLREAEMLSQTVMRVCMDWPRLLGVPLAIEAARIALSTQTMLETDVFGGPNWKVVGGVAMTPDMDAARTHLNVLKDMVDQVFDQNGLADKLLQALDARGLNGFGALADEAGPELGALSRHWDDAHVAQAREAFGAGLRARLLARFVDMHSLPVTLLHTVDKLGPCDGGGDSALADGEGVATVETARGALTHTVRVQDGKVIGYAIDAPTDENFLNGGVVATGLLGAQAVDLDTLNMAAELHVLAVDPCVSCTLEISGAEISDA